MEDGEEEEEEKGAPSVSEPCAKLPVFDRCLSGLEIRIEKGALANLDEERLKEDIKKWAHAVAVYASMVADFLSFGRLD
ncbi:hypothetical protein AMTRI_Chr05g68870 [Amborella trichopoda]